MRTPLLIGLALIAKAIDASVVVDKADQLTWLLLILIIVDVVEFLKKITE